MELLSEPGLTLIAGLNHWFDQGWQEGSGVITSKRVVVEWTLACSVSSVKDWREKERIKEQEVDNVAAMEEEPVKVHNVFSVGEEVENLLLNLKVLNLGVGVEFAMEGSLYSLPEMSLY